MSHVTDVVFIVPAWRTAETFLDLMERHQGYRPTPVDSSDHCTSLSVFHLGVDYMAPELREWLKGGPASPGWPAGAVLYLYGEDDDAPTVITT